MKAKLNIINAYELKPDHKYILLFERGSLPRDSLEYLQEHLQKTMQVTTVAVALAGDPKAVKLIDVTEETNDD